VIEIWNFDAEGHLHRLVVIPGFLEVVEKAKTPTIKTKTKKK
jgi:hypothetical protein